MKIKTLKKIIITFLLFLKFINCNLIQRSNSILWDDKQYYTNWNDAEISCRKNGMRLPDYKEMLAAKKSKITDQWKKEINFDLVISASYWLATNTKTDGYIFPIHVDTDTNSMSANKKTNKLVRCVKDFLMEKRIKLSKPISFWSSYQGYMTYNAAEEVCAKIGMKLPTEKEIRLSYGTITNSWVEEFDSEDISYWVDDGLKRTLFNPGIGIYAFHSTEGNAHVRCKKIK